MENKPYSRITEERLIEKYKKEFYMKTGKILRVDDYRPEGLPYPVVSLMELEAICAQFLPDTHSSIKDDTRQKEVLYPRMMFASLAYTMNYPIRRISTYIERDRTTIYHAISAFDDLMSTKNPYCTEMYEKTVTQLKSTYESTPSAVSEPSDYAQSVISAVLLQEQDEASVA